MSKIYAIAFIAVVILDAFCVTLVFPYLPRLDNISNAGIALLPAIFIAFVSAIVIGIILLELVGGILLKNLLERVGMSQKLSRAIVKNLYATAAPMLNAVALIMWTKLYPELGFYRIFPDALIAGMILHYIDYGVVVPWFFRLEEALK
ncbi:MAG: hypothetical protein HYT20_00530 [Candidatus Nealsonbacteria bacterium]|nr:hypothetical protein [Candidatus Nealsonbacteria bacterium]